MVVIINLRLVHKLEQVCEAILGDTLPLWVVIGEVNAAILCRNEVLHLHRRRLEIEHIPLEDRAMLVISDTLCRFQIVLQEDGEGVRGRLLVGWSFNYEGVLVQLVSIAEVEDHRPSLRVDGGHLPITQPHGMNLSRSIHVIFDHVLQVDVFEHDICDARLNVVGRLEDNGVVFRHGEGMLDGVTICWNSSDNHSLLGVRSDHLVDDEVEAAGLFVEVGAKADHGAIWQFP